MALREAEEAERMWEEQMGGGAGARGGAGSSSDGAPPLRRTRSFSEADKPAKTHSRAREVAGAQLKERYQQIDAAQKSRQIVQLAPNQIPKRKGAPGSSHGASGVRPRLS